MPPAAPPLVVQKYGGSSLATPARLRRVAARVAAVRRGGCRVVVVVSAMGDATDALLALAAEVRGAGGAADGRELDLLLATGEQAAAALLALALAAEGVPARALTGARAGLRTDGRHGDARIVALAGGRRGGVQRALAAGCVPVVAGFQGLSRGGEVTTLGRGGSDTTAVALAAALGADRCDIYTDVDGIFTADPRRVPGARRHDVLSHRDTLLLTHAGAGVLHPRAAALAAAHCLTLRVLSSLEDGPERGTRIEGENTVEMPRILGIAAAGGAARVVVDAAAGASMAEGPGAALRALAAAGVPVEHLEEKAGAGGRRMALLVPAAQGDEACRALRAAFAEPARVALEPPVARVTVVASGMGALAGRVAAALAALEAGGVDAEGLGISPMGLTLWVAPGHAARAVALLHAVLVEEAGAAAGAGGVRRPA
jgi:aspartate kinase